MTKFVYLKVDTNSIPANSVGVVVGEKTNQFEVQFVYKDIKTFIDKDKLVIFDPLETGDGHPHKVCNVCHKYLPTEQFARNQNGINNRIIRRPSCNACREIIDGVDMTTKDKREWNSRKPNMEIWECPICHKKTIPGLTSKIVLDHDHETGRVRGWICDSCNTGIGRFKDDIKLLESAITYLETN